MKTQRLPALTQPLPRVTQPLPATTQRLPALTQPLPAEAPMPSGSSALNYGLTVFPAAADVVSRSAANYLGIDPRHIGQQLYDALWQNSGADYGSSPKPISGSEAMAWVDKNIVPWVQDKLSPYRPNDTPNALRQWREPQPVSMPESKLSIGDRINMLRYLGGL